jgi:hypothetical protein
LASFQWGGRTWNTGQLAAFKAYLAAHGGNYATWSANHPDAAAALTGQRVAVPSDPLRTAVPATHPTRNEVLTPSGPAPAPAAGGGGAAASGGAPGTTPNLLDLIAGDPLYQQEKGALDTQDVTDAHARRAAIQQALIQYGLVPSDLNGLGLSPEALAILQGDIDPTTIALAGKNTDEGLSLTARLNQAHADALSQLTNSLAARGMLSSGTTGFETGREDLRNKQSASDALKQLMGAIGGYIGQYTQGVTNRAGQLGGYATDAAGRVKDLLGDTPPGGGAAGGTSPTNTAPVNPVPAPFGPPSVPGNPATAPTIVPGNPAVGTDDYLHIPGVGKKY